MADRLSKFTTKGSTEFVKWIQLGAAGTLPRDLLEDPTYAEPIPGNLPISDEAFPDRYAFGCYLVELLKPFDRSAISFDRGLWSWLAAFYFEQLCPRDEAGKRTLRRYYVYALSESRVYYRHLVRTPWFLVSVHGDACRYLLARRSGDQAPLSRQSYLLDQLAARQFVISSPSLIGAAERLYTDPRTGLPRGAGSKGSGSPRRLALLANQLSLTYDIHDMPVSRLLELLPEEFGSAWRQLPLNLPRRSPGTSSAR